MSENIMSQTIVEFTSPKQELARRIEKLCLIRDKITLSSGRQSDFYFNMKMLASDPHGLRLASQLLVQHIVQTDARYVGGLEMGAVPLTAALLTRTEAVRHGLRGFFIRKQAKTHGLQKRIEGLQDETALKGQQVIVLDDVTTTGGSALEAVRIIRECGGNVKQVLTLLDRQEGAAENMAKEAIELTAILKASDVLGHTKEQS